jgi:hypothetical protein
MAKPHALSNTYRLNVAVRALAASVGGFVMVSVIGVALALALSQSGLMARPAAVSLMTLLSWLIWTGIAMWAFHERHLWRLLIGLAGPTLLAGAIVLFLTQS